MKVFIIFCAVMVLFGGCDEPRSLITKKTVAQPPSGPGASYDPATGREFYATNLVNNNFHKVYANLAATGTHCLIYVDTNLSPQLTSAQAAAIKNEYDTVIYPKMADAFGDGSTFPVYDVDDNGKVIFLVMDVWDGYTQQNGSYTGGYFYSYHMYSKNNPQTPYSNQADMLFLDAYPTEAASTAFYATMTHELQHLINYSVNETTPDVVLSDGSRGKNIRTETWINEGLSTASEYLYGTTLSQTEEGWCDPNARIDYYIAGAALSGSLSLAYGNNFYIWNGFWENVPRNDYNASTGFVSDQVANYATAFLFFQWLRIQAGTDGEKVYKKILDAGCADYTSITGVMKDYNSSLADWDVVLKNWLLSNHYYSNASGLVGYGKDVSFKNLITMRMNYIKTAINRQQAAKNEPLVTITAPTWGKIFDNRKSTATAQNRYWAFAPGEAVFSAIPGGSWSPPADSGQKIKYLGTASATSLDESSPYTGTMLLTRNTDTDTTTNTAGISTAGDQKGYMASMGVSEEGEIARSTRNARGGSLLPKPAGPVDVRIIAGNGWNKHER